MRAHAAMTHSEGVVLMNGSSVKAPDTPLLHTASGQMGTRLPSLLTGRFDAGTGCTPTGAKEALSFLPPAMKMPGSVDDGEVIFDASGAFVEQHFTRPSFRSCRPPPGLELEVEELGPPPGLPMPSLRSPPGLFVAPPPQPPTPLAQSACNGALSAVLLSTTPTAKESNPCARAAVPPPVALPYTDLDSFWGSWLLATPPPTPGSLNGGSQACMATQLNWGTEAGSRSAQPRPHNGEGACPGDVCAVQVAGSAWPFFGITPLPPGLVQPSATPPGAAAEAQRGEQAMQQSRFAPVWSR